MTSSVHVNSGDCINHLSIALAESRTDPEVFDEAWKALGVVVAALYRRHPSERPTVVPAPPKPEPEPREVARQTLSEPAQKSSAAAYSVCPHCGFESVTERGTKIHVKRMHGEKADTPAKITAREAWERSHGPNLPFPGDREAAS